MENKRNLWSVLVKGENVIWKGPNDENGHLGNGKEKEGDLVI